MLSSTTDAVKMTAVFIDIARLVELKQMHIHMK
jgi:hypothetical protein